MASSLDEPTATVVGGDGFDPFMTSPVGLPHLRHSNFDTSLFALGPGTSLEQVKLAIEAHLRDTERRMEEAGKLGTALVQQQKQLTEKLREVEQLQSEAEMTPELRQRLVEIEKDYNEVARQSARALLPKQRVPSNEAPGSSPFSPDKHGSRRSVSPSKFETLAAPSPSKAAAPPSRKARNQAASLIDNVEFAAEISTSLLAQVRQLHAVLSMREEELKEVKADRSRLEVELEAFQQRLRTLDESENRYKDENWNLETQIHELIAAQKAGTEREKKLTQALTVLQAERTAVQRELEEVKDSLAKQEEKHSAEIKNLEIELGTSRRAAATAETERANLQKRVNELTGQNQELARAVSALQRGRTLEREAPAGSSGDDSHSAPDHNTPEHSPPPSPLKPILRTTSAESEAFKASITHAQRTIQTLRTNLHREKTEKLELKRMLQEARDEIEKLRNDPNPAPRRSRKPDHREPKKPAFKVTQLGIPRSSRIEVVEDDDWEDQSEIASPRVLSRRNSTVHHHRSSGLFSAAAAVPATHLETANEQLESANETSDAAFETANDDRGTETEGGFQTGAEDTTDDNNSGTETETDAARGINSIKRPPPLPPHHASNHHHHHYAFDSAASTSSSDDDEYADIKTPSGPRTRMRASRGSAARRSRQFSEEPSAPGSPSSVTAHPSTTPGGQSLFAELNQFDNSDEDSCPGVATPSRRSVRSFTPATPATPRSVPGGRASPVPEVPTLPRIMVDCGTMTDPVYIRPASADGTVEKESSYADDAASVIRRSDVLKSPPSMESMGTVARGQADPAAHWLGDQLREGAGGDGSSWRSSLMSYSDASVQHDWDMSSKLALFPQPPKNLAVSPVQGLEIEPVVEPEQPAPPLGVSSILSEQTEPVPEVVVPPALSLAAVVSEHVEPVVLPEPEPPVLGMPALASQAIEPVEPETPKPEPSTVSAPVVVLDIEPVEPVSVPAPLTFSSVQAEEVEPVKIEIEPEPEPEPVVLSASAVLVQEVAPVEVEIPAAPAAEVRSLAAAAPVPVAVPEPLSLSLSDIASEQVEPRELEPASPVKLAMSTIAAEHVEPSAEEPAPPVQLSLSTIAAAQVEPVVEEPPAPVKLSISTIAATQLEPVAEEPPTPIQLSISTIASKEVEPVQEPSAPVPTFVVSPIKTLETAPQEPREAPRSGLTVILTKPEMESVEPRSPKRNAFIIPRDLEGGEAQDATAAAGEESAAHQLAQAVTVDQGAQTTLTSDAIDQMLREKLQPPAPAALSRSHSFSSVSTPATVRIHRPRQESFDTPLRHKGLGIDAGLDALEGAASVRRPGSSASGMASIDEVPPLPANHKEVIEAARSGSANGGQGTIGNMGPPSMPASALRAQTPSLRPRTPTGAKYPATLSAPVSGRMTPTHRSAGKPSYASGLADVHDAQSISRATLTSRKSSISSFTSEMDNRFNIHGAGAFDPQGFGPNTDPRMIQAITQTMIGEYLWKYTRKTGRGDTMSEKRHRRYFWVHPYTRTLYWSDRDPSTAGRHELRAKSVQIERVHVVADDNPMPPGLHRKSLVVVSPGRSIKFTCTTGQRHETWFNALSYLLLRTANDGQSDVEEVAGNIITREDIEEFNPGYGARAANGHRAPADPSVSSYTSQSVRNSPPMDMASFSVPTLTPSRSRASQGQAQAQKFGTLSRLSGYLRENKVSGTFASMRSRSVQGRHTSLGIYEAHDSEVQDSAEDLREMIERQDREADRLENVRACCDGKHDVGTLSSSAKKSGRHSVAGFRSPTPSAAPTPVGTVRSRV
ncbi:hypothetical protein VTJ83DRAFT_1596 [Remersonia thermophila]|uniref:PH domain-containing protein n=1 Tax=Remersonia thermophila TaxID=72144 RepID=A0ABR4DGN3_9PEZI